PNALWHMDGHHKLIQWGIIIHGFINGFCHMVHFVGVYHFYLSCGSPSTALCNPKADT
ncbi:hypothetical protein F5J12DRAFT_728872, partial [Pisolithus orientalis]|uniref:uncharacterized protein n=1 Tax=Pisolithus orientalis TaxID=936130 RepID=UPI0022255B60